MITGYETVLSAAAEAPWLVMVHGMSQDRRVFSSQVEAFRDRFRILLIDLPGHGLSAEIPGPFGHHEFTEAVAGAVKDADVGHCHFWGTHTGATVGLLLAARAPELFTSLILEGPVMPGETPPSVAGAVGGARAAALEHGLVAAKEWWFTKSPWFQVMRARAIECRALEHRRIIEEFGGAPWVSTDSPEPVEPIEAALSALEIPVLVYNGEHDHAEFLDTAESVQRLIPGCRRDTIADAGAFAAWEFPDRVNRLVATFLS